MAKVIRPDVEQLWRFAQREFKLPQGWAPRELVGVGPGEKAWFGLLTEETGVLLRKSIDGRLWGKLVAVYPEGWVTFDEVVWAQRSTNVEELWEDERSARRWRSSFKLYVAKTRHEFEKLEEQASSHYHLNQRLAIKVVIRLATTGRLTMLQLAQVLWKWTEGEGFGRRASLWDAYWWMRLDLENEKMLKLKGRASDFKRLEVFGHVTEALRELVNEQLKEIK